MPQPPFNSPIQTEPTIKGAVTIKPVWQNWLQLAQIYLANLTGSGPTSARPTSNLWVGQPFFDTTLVKQVVWNGSAWVTNGNDGTVTAVTGTTPISSSGGTTPDISITEASATVDGYLSATDWNTFNNKQPAGTYVNSVSGTAPVVSSGGTSPVISMAQSSATANGWLSSADWSTFNGKLSGSVKPSFIGVDFTNSVNRPVTDMLGDRLSVLDFGVSVNNSGAASANTTAIQNALNAANVGAGIGGYAGTVYFPPGFYYINGALSIPTGVSVIGAGPGSTYIIQNNLSSSIFTLTGAAVWNLISGLNFTYPSSSSVGDAISIQKTLVLIQDFEINNANRGIAISGTCNTIYCSNFRIANSKTAGIQIVAGSGQEILDCFFTQFQIESGSVSPTGDPSYATSGNISLNGNVNARFSQGEVLSGAYALRLDSYGGGTPKYCTFTDVYFDSGYYGVPINASIYNTFTGCWFSGGRGGGGNGVDLTSATATLFEGCTFFGNGQCGLRLGAGSVFTSVNGCAFNNNSSNSANNWHGVYTDSGTSNYSITGCTISNIGPGGGTQNHGIFINSGNVNYTVTGNVAIGNGASGIYNGSVPSSNGIISSNVTDNLANLPTGSVITTPGRSPGVTYTNGSLSPLFVSAWFNSTGGNIVVSLTVNGTTVCVQSTSVNNGCTVQGFVPPGGTYLVGTAGPANFGSWVEC